MELFIDLGLKEIASIIQILGESTDLEDFIETVNVNGNDIRIIKDDNSVIINSLDGRNMSISIDYSEEETALYYKKATFINHKVNIIYYLDDGSQIELSNNIPLERGYKGFTNVQRHDLMKGLKCKYISNDGKEASFTLDLNKICLKDNNKVYEFTDKGIVCGNKVVSLDGNDLLTVSGTEVPEIKTLTSFDVEKEKEKIENIINTTEELHSFTIDALKDAERLLDRRERYVKDLFDFYNRGDLLAVRNAIDTRDRIMDAVDNEIIKPNELESVSNSLRSKYLESNKKLLCNKKILSNNKRSV